MAVWFFIDPGSMVALESLPMHVRMFPHFWLRCLKMNNGLDFVNMLCLSCNYFKEYVSLILSQERNFLEDDQVYELVKICLPKVSAIPFR